MVIEMYRFRDKLDKRNVPWWDESDSDIDRTVFEINKVRWSVINGYGTYGGWRRDQGNQGLLEISNGKEEVGYITSDDAEQIIFKGGTE